jgi:hypothetical protein
MSLFEDAASQPLDPQVEAAKKMLRQSDRGAIRFRLTIIIIMLAMIMVAETWRAYRNEAIWNACVRVPEVVRQHARSLGL